MITELDIENVKGFIYLTFDSKISEDIRSNTSRMNVDSPYSGSEYMNNYGYPRYGSIVKPIRINTKTLDKFAYCNNLDNLIDSTFGKDKDYSCIPIEAAYAFAYAACWCAMLHPKAPNIQEKAMELSRRCQRAIYQAVQDIIENCACEDIQDLSAEVQQEIIMPLYFNGPFSERECPLDISENIDFLNELGNDYVADNMQFGGRSD